MRKIILAISALIASSSLPVLGHIPCPAPKDVIKSLKTTPELKLCYTFNFIPEGRFRVAFMLGEEANTRTGTHAPSELKLTEETIHAKEVCSYQGDSLTLVLVLETDFPAFWTQQLDRRLYAYGKSNPFEFCPKS